MLINGRGFSLGGGVGRVHPTGICTTLQLQVCACNDRDVLYILYNMYEFTYNSYAYSIYRHLVSSFCACPLHYT